MPAGPGPTAKSATRKPASRTPKSATPVSTLSEDFCAAAATASRVTAMAEAVMTSIGMSMSCVIFVLPFLLDVRGGEQHLLRQRVALGPPAAVYAQAAVREEVVAAG